jgi:membrane protease YdiL (CAAX protease family)
MHSTVKAERTLAAWRDCAIGLSLFLAALFLFPSMRGLSPAAQVTVQAALLAVVILAHTILNRLGRFAEITSTVLASGRIGAGRLSLVGVAVLFFMSGVWRIAQTIGGPIDRPLPWGPPLPDRPGLAVGYLIPLFFYVIVTAPIIEELCFRGWMQRGLGLRFNPAAAIVMPALLFAAAHATVYSHPGYLVIPLALGLALGLVADRSRALWPSVVLHVLWNSMIFVIAARNATRPLSWREPNALEVIAILTEIGLSGVVLLRVLPRADGCTQPANPQPVLQPAGGLVNSDR